MIKRREIIAAAAALGLKPGALLNAPKISSSNHRTIRRIAFGSCAADWRAQPIWPTILNEDPDLYLSLGDAIYADYDGEKLIPVTPTSLAEKWAALGAKPEFREFRSKVPMMATWDNHDYGSYDQGADFSLKEISKHIFLDFWGEPSGSARRLRDGIYDARILGRPGRRVQVILLDTRTFKSPGIPDTRSSREKATEGIVGRYVPNFDPSATLLGGEQFDWLARELRKPAEVRLICSSTQFVADEKGMDEWGNFPCEKERLLDLIRSCSANGVIFLSGNVHFSEISRESDFPYPLIDHTSSGMTADNINQQYAAARNTKRLHGPFAAINFGLVSIEWESATGVKIKLSTLDCMGCEVLSHTVELTELAIRD